VFCQTNEDGEFATDNLLPWRYSRPTQTPTSVTCCRSCFSRGLGLMISRGPLQPLQLCEFCDLLYLVFRISVCFFCLLNREQFYVQNILFFWYEMGACKTENGTKSLAPLPAFLGLSFSLCTNIFLCGNIFARWDLYICCDLCGLLTYWCIFEMSLLCRSYHCPF